MTGSGLAMAAPARADPIRCPAGPGVGRDLIEIDAYVRLAWITDHLRRERRQALRWSWAWGGGLGASAVGSLVAAPLVSPGDRVDWYVSAASAAIGVVPLLVAPLDVIGRPQVYADSGVEDVNTAVDETLLSACLDRVLAQVEVAYSNSMIEAFWRSLKHGWLYLNTLDSIERLRSLVAFYVEQHNEQMPHRAFGGQTPDEIYFGAAIELSADLATARSKARAARLDTNRALVCEVCVGQQNVSATSEIPP